MQLVINKVVHSISMYIYVLESARYNTVNVKSHQVKLTVRTTLVQ